MPARTHTQVLCEVGSIVTKTTGHTLTLTPRLSHRQQGSPRGWARLSMPLAMAPKSRPSSYIQVFVCAYVSVGALVCLCYTCVCAFARARVCVRVFVQHSCIAVPFLPSFIPPSFLVFFLFSYSSDRPALTVLTAALCNRTSSLSSPSRHLFPCLCLRLSVSLPFSLPPPFSHKQRAREWSERQVRTERMPLSTVPGQSLLVS